MGRHGKDGSKAGRDVSDSEIEWIHCGTLYGTSGSGIYRPYWELVFSDEEIQAVKDEFYNEHTYIGTDRPVVIDDKSANYILRSRRRHDDWLKSLHPSHDMTDWFSSIKSPVGTPRFYQTRKCKRCEYEQYYHAAGKFIDGELLEKCRSED